MVRVNAGKWESIPDVDLMSKDEGTMSSSSSTSSSSCSHQSHSKCLLTGADCTSYQSTLLIRTAISSASLEDGDSSSGSDDTRSEDNLSIGSRHMQMWTVQRKMNFLTAMAAIGGFLFGYDTGVSAAGESTYI